MSHRQAFHTSCRRGLAGHAGFQFNAASAGLDDEQLARLAAGHTGYRAAPDAPPEPTPAEIEEFPVSLRYLPIDGVGRVVSRTAYVGRELRGAGGEPDSGRFGNYFSHIVVADEGGFDGLLPAELWGAPHWTTRESGTPELPPLARLEPGPIDLDSVLADLLPRRSGALATVLDACLGAALGGPRAVVVEDDPALAAAWVAWVSFSLPPDSAAELTFSTFEGRPRVADALRFCVTTPACDLEFSGYELGSTVNVVSTGAPAPAEPSLYARVLAALAEDGAEAVAAAVRELPAGLTAVEAGARVAVLGARAALASAAEAPAIVAAIADAFERAPAPALAVQSTAVPADDSSESLRQWARLHQLARRSTDPSASEIADESLRRLLAVDPIAAVDAKVPSSSPTKPSVAVLALWLERVSAAVGSDRLAPALAAGARLGLAGCNTALDRELAAAIAADFDDPAVRSAYDELAIAGHDLVVETVAQKLAAAVAAGGSLEGLRHVARDPVAREAIRARAEEDGSFEAVAAWQLLRAEGESARRPEAVAELAALAATERHAELIRGLYPDRGPTAVAEHAELLEGWRRGGRSAPPADHRRALACLAGVPLRWEPEPAALFEAIERGPKEVRLEPEYAPWWLLSRCPPRGRSFPDWAGVVIQARSHLVRLPPERGREVDVLVADVAVASLEEPGYEEGLEALLGGMRRDWPVDLGEALGRALAGSPNPDKLLGRAYLSWRRLRGFEAELLDTALPVATGDISAKRLAAVGPLLGDLEAEWERWLEEHPPRGMVSRAMRGVLRRGERS
jgi:GTPase-associated protein 1, N-terminal domain type 2/GTPase-associated protein 1, middle domain